GELAFHEFGDQFDFAEAETNLGGRNVDLHGVFGIGQQTLHFQHGLARHDDVVTLLNAFDRGAAVRQSVSVGGHGLHGARFEHEKQPVQIVPDVLLGHG